MMKNPSEYSNPNPNSEQQLWVDGLLCAYEFVPGPKKHIKLTGKLDSHEPGLFKGSFDAEVAVKSTDVGTIEDIISQRKIPPSSSTPELGPKSRSNLLLQELSSQKPGKTSNEDQHRSHQEQEQQEVVEKRKTRSSHHWVPIGWNRLEELVGSVQIDADWLWADDAAVSSENSEYEFLSVADVAIPYWEPKSGPTWWCNVLAGHPRVEAWLSHSHKWLHPAVSSALKDESKLISERMKHLFYEVPVRVAGGLLFELLGLSIGDPHRGEDDVPIVLRSWQAQKFLLTSLHVKGTVNHLNVLGIFEVQDLIGAGGAEAPKSVLEVIAHLANRLARWDDRLFRKSVFGAADEVELKFVNRRGNEDLALLSIILNQEIKRLSTQKYDQCCLGFASYNCAFCRNENPLMSEDPHENKNCFHVDYLFNIYDGRKVIRVKWQLHAREEILFELANHLKGSSTQAILAAIRHSTREMIAEQEAVRDRIFTVQDAVQNAVRSVLQDKSVRITHNLTVFGGCGLVLSIITGLFGINLQGIPGSANSPHAFRDFSVCFLVLGLVLVGLGFVYLGLKKPISEEQLLKRKRELQQLVKSFQHAVESHENFRYAGPTSYYLPIDQGTDYDLSIHGNNTDGYSRLI